jgi:hypothetical protein
MERNFTTCPHCASQGRVKSVQPSVRKTRLVSRSDSKTYHLYLEEEIFHRNSRDPHSKPEIWALFRYDLDPAQIKGESSGVVIPGEESDEDRLEEAADLMAMVLSSGTALQRQYRIRNGRLMDNPAIPTQSINCC